ncbi:KATNB1-like protein 1 [Aulostomus maculatus]
MVSKGDDGEYHNLEDAIQNDAAHYRVTHPHATDAPQVDEDKNKEFYKKRFPVNRSGNTGSRVKRVVSCKRKTHHITVTRKKQHGAGRPYDAANKENVMNCMQEMLDMDPWEFTLHVDSNQKAGRTGSEMLAELLKDHNTMTEVLFGRNLRLKVALTLWQRNVGELLTYFLRIQDVGVFVDFLPVMSESMDEGSTRITTGCCVDLLPLVKKVLTYPYEEYVIAGLKWLTSVLKIWCDELTASGCRGPTNLTLDKNFQVFIQHLLELWHQQPSFKSFPGAAGDLVKVIDSFLSQLI